MTYADSAVSRHVGDVLSSRRMHLKDSSELCTLYMYQRWTAARYASWKHVWRLYRHMLWLVRALP